MNRLARVITTIKVSKKTVEELTTLKIHPRQSYEEIVVNLLDKYREEKIGFSSEKPGEITTIKLSKNTVDRLNKLKIHPRQSYEEVIEKLLRYYYNQNNQKNGN